MKKIIIMLFVIVLAVFLTGCLNQSTDQPGAKTKSKQSDGESIKLALESYGYSVLGVNEDADGSFSVQTSNSWSVSSEETTEADFKERMNNLVALTKSTEDDTKAVFIVHKVGNVEYATLEFEESDGALGFAAFWYSRDGYLVAFGNDIEPTRQDISAAIGIVENDLISIVPPAKSVFDDFAEYRLV